MMIIQTIHPSNKIMKKYPYALHTIAVVVVVVVVVLAVLSHHSALVCYSIRVREGIPP